MIAIPVEYNQYNEMIPSKLFGNVEFFALYDDTHQKRGLIANTKKGNGIKTAQRLIDYGVHTILYTLLGDGPFKTFMKNKNAVLYMGKEPQSLDTVIAKLKSNQLISVDESNAKEYLDSGTTSQSCECGCAS